MKALGINGSPRKKWNTATLLSKALEGAASEGAETEMIHLYDLDFKGCKSCFLCKERGGESYGKCAVKDDLTPILEKIETVDALILGSPVYLGTVSGEMRSFLERLIFPYLTYTDPPGSLFPKEIKVGLIYTMNAPEEFVEKYDYAKNSFSEMVLERILGPAETVMCCDTYQFDDYSKVVADRFDPEKKAQRCREVFPKDCKEAFEMGIKLGRG